MAMEKPTDICASAKATDNGTSAGQENVRV